MGRRPGDPESAGPGLAENNAGDITKLAPDFLHERLIGGAVRLVARILLPQQRLDPGGRASDQPSGAPIKPALPGFPGFMPAAAYRLVEIVLRTGAEAAADQPKRLANTRQPHDWLGAFTTPRFRLVLKNQVEHSSGLSPARLRKF